MQNTASVDGFDVVTNDFRHNSEKNMRVHGLEGIPARPQKNAEHIQPTILYFIV